MFIPFNLSYGQSITIILIRSLYLRDFYFNIPF